MEKERIKSFRKKYIFRKGERLGPTQILSKHLEKQMYANDNTDNLVLLGGQEDDVTENYIIPNILQMTGSYIIYDTGRHLYERVGPVLKEHGYAIHHVNLENWYSDFQNYNPLEYIHDEKDMTILLDCIMRNATPENPEHDKIFAEAEQHLLRAGIYYLLEHCEDKKMKNLFGLRNLFSSEELCEDKLKVKEKLDPMFLKLPEESIARIEYEKYQELTASAREINVIESCLCRLLCLCRLNDCYSLEERVINRNTIKLEKMGKKRMAVFVTTGPRSCKNFVNLIPAFMYQAYKAITNCEKNNYPVTFILDQIRGIHCIPDFEKMVTKGEKSHISFVIVANTANSLNTCCQNGILTNKALQNSFNLVYLGGFDYEALVYIRDRLKIHFQSEKKYWKYMNELNLRINDRKESLVLTTFADPIVDKKYDGRKHPLYYQIKAEK